MSNRGINKVTLIGNLGADPIIRFTANGTAIANFSIATSETWNDKETGEQKQNTEWHKIVIFGKVAEIARDYLKKGAQVYIEGKLQTKKWTDNKGIDRYTPLIVINSMGGTMQILGTRSESLDQPEPQPKAPEPPMDFDDDIPF